ncbi:dihydroneopterin aldolase [Chloroflexota bacterium]
MDQIIIKDLKIKGIIGIYDWEREVEQDILINIRCFIEKSEASTTDDINDCLDYENLAKKVKAKVKDSRRHTVEALAEDIANVCLAVEYARKVIVRVEKPNALEGISSTGIQIER